MNFSERRPHARARPVVFDLRPEEAAKLSASSGQARFESDLIMKLRPAETRDRLEDELRAVLNDAPRLGVEPYRTKVAVVEVVLRHSVVGAVEEIEELYAELEVDPLGDAGVLENGHVGCPDDRPSEGITS